MEGLFKILKSFLYAFVIGVFFWTGGYGYAVIFTRDNEKRERVANWNIGIALLITLIIIISFIYQIMNDPFNAVLTGTLIKILIYHFLISFVGSIIYLIWWIGSMFSRD